MLGSQGHWNIDGNARKNYQSLLFLRLWDNRATAQQYKAKEWSARNRHVFGMKSVQHTSLLNPDKVLMPPFHTKLVLINNFVKAVAKQDSNGFAFLSKKFPKQSQAI